MSSSPEKAGRSSKSRVKSPCSPQAVGDTDADAEVLLDVIVVVSEEEVEDPLSDELDAWLLAEDDSVDETACELGAEELRPEDVAGPFAKELPIDVKAWVLGTTEVRLEFARAAEELGAVMLPTEDIVAGLSVGSEETSLATPVVVLYPGIAVEEMLVPAASTSEAPAVELPEMVEEAF
jgi:hypothetical protein